MSLSRWAATLPERSCRASTGFGAGLSPLHFTSRQSNDKI